MSNTNSLDANTIDIDEAKAKSLLQWLIMTEKRNVKSKEKSDQQMVAAIQKKIEEVVQCY